MTPTGKAKAVFNTSLGRMMFVGQGFVTAQNVMGQILELDSAGNVLSYKKLFDQASLDQMFPRAVSAMNGEWVMISNQTSEHLIPQESIVRLSMVLPVALTSTNRSDNFFIAGVLQFPRDSQGHGGAREPKVRPVQAFGVQAVNPRDLIQMVHQITKMTATSALNSFLPALRAQLEDFILQSSVRKAEEEVSIRKRNNLDITAVQPEVAVALLHEMTPDADDSRSVGYCGNVLSIEWKGGVGCVRVCVWTQLQQNRDPSIGWQHICCWKPPFQVSSPPIL